MWACVVERYACTCACVARACEIEHEVVGTLPGPGLSLLRGARVLVGPRPGYIRRRGCGNASSVLGSGCGGDSGSEEQEIAARQLRCFFTAAGKRPTLHRDS